MSVLPLSFEEDAATIRAIVTLAEAVDHYIGDLARRSKSTATRTAYRRLLAHFLADTGKKLPDELELADYERFLNRWTNASSSTLASHVSLTRGFSRFLFERGYTETDVAAVLKRPRRKRPEDLDVVSVSRKDVERMLAACRDWQELLTIGAAVFLGNRRGALARIRRRDVDLERGPGPPPGQGQQDPGEART